MYTTKTFRRSGMTLIEIMISILILSVGLLGVLAAVPFGAMQMGKMVEKDFVTNTALNAHTILATNDWYGPFFWYDRTYVSTDAYNHYYHPFADSILTGTGPESGLNFTFPTLLDPLGYANFPFDYSTDVVANNYIELYNNSSLSDYNKLVRRINIVFPWSMDYFENAANSNTYFNGLNRLFRSPDDIVYDREDNSTKRPTVLTETSENRTYTAFTGEYSWMAMMTPKAVGSGNSFDNMTFPYDYDNAIAANRASVVDVQTDVIVFRGRVPGESTDFITADATVVGSGYAGGGVTLNNLFLANGEAAAPSDLSDNLDSATHLLLIGPADGAVDADLQTNYNVNGQFAEYADKQYVARWYKIANFSDNGSGFSVTLIGETTPQCWIKTANDPSVKEPAKYVRAVVFKNVRGVLSKTVRLESD